MLSSLLYRVLRIISQAIIRRYKPIVIAVTGSVGKTSTKDAIALVLGAHVALRASEKTYNNEIGVPCTVIGVSSPGSSPLRWLALFGKALGLLLLRRTYPQYLVLEFGADKPGDIRHLTRCAPPAIGVITALERVHEEKFGSFEAIVREKLSLIDSLGPQGRAVLNADYEKLAHAADNLANRAFTYGVTAAHAEVRATDVQIQENNGVIVLHAVVHHGSERRQLIIPGLLHAGQLGPVLAAIATGILVDIPFEACVAAAADYRVPPGRGRVIAGIRGSIIIDDTYNASPASAKAALDFFNYALPFVTRRIAVFGDMLELGGYTEAGHREVGEHFAAVRGDTLITVGTLAAHIAEGARSAGLGDDAIRSFSDRTDAIRYLAKNLQHGDCVIVKGSQGARMEHIVKATMQRREEAHDLLVRQNPEWLRR